MLQLLVSLWLLIATSSAAPGFDHGFASLFHSAPAPIIPAPVFSAPVIPAPTVIKTISAPVISAPILKTPVFASAPVIKAVAPATSYATVTQFITHHAPVVKTVVAPQPILKSFAVAAPLPLHGYSALPSFHH